MASAVVRLEDLDLSQIRQTSGDARPNLSTLGNALSVAGKSYEHGLGVHAESYFRLNLGGRGKTFRVKVGMDDDGGGHWGSAIRFWIEGDGRILAQSDRLTKGDEAEELVADLSGVDRVTLVACAAGFGVDGDHADWLDGEFEMLEGAPEPFGYPPEPTEILTPKPGTKPRLTGPTVIGVRPGHPIFVAFTATGRHPMSFEADLLPGDLVLDPETGILTGTLHYNGEHPIEVTASNSAGKTTRTVTLIVGDDIALTPPLGWNSWNCWGPDVDQEKIRAAARVIAAKLRDHGWTYVNIDDGWQCRRGGPNLAIQPNRRFPHIKALVETIHEAGLKAGIYSTPWMVSYAGHIGSTCDQRDGSYDWLAEAGDEARCPLPAPYQTFGRHSFVQNDVEQIAEWEFDFLKYDWNPIDPTHAKEAADNLRCCGRDIVLSLSNTASIDNAKGLAAHAQMWRSSGDLSDTWGPLKATAFGHSDWAPHQRPGHWADEDMLVVGRLTLGGEMRDCRLTPNEQYLHMTQWCLLASPLLIGCDLESLDKFTLGLLTNDEVLEVNQDPLGLMAKPVRQTDAEQVWAKRLADGSVAVGLYNTSEDSREVSVTWKELEFKGNLPVRDLWRQKNLGKFRSGFSASVGRHGAVLVKFGPGRKPSRP